MTSKEGAMNDPDPTPDDLLVSAVLDGVASPDDVARVAGDPVLTARLEQFRSVARAVGGPVPLVDPVVRGAHLAAALAEARRLAPPAEGTPPLAAAAPLAAAPAAPPPAPPAPPAPAVDLATARTRRRPIGTVILSIAAAVVLVAAVAAGLARVTSESGSGGDEAASSATESTQAADAAAGGSDAALPEVQGDSSTLADSGQAPASTTVPGSSSASSEGGIDPALPSLGAFTKAGDLAAAVRGRLVLQPRPAPAGEEPVCQDDFPVPTTLLGRATVDGEEGLVYVETAPGTGRRLWLVDPATAATAGEACRRVVPVQSL